MFISSKNKPLEVYKITPRAQKKTPNPNSILNLGALLVVPQSYLILVGAPPPPPQHFVLSVVHFGLEGSEGKRTLAGDNKHLIHVEICRNNQKLSSLLGSNDRNCMSFFYQIAVLVITSLRPIGNSKGGYIICHMDY